MANNYLPPIYAHPGGKARVAKLLASLIPPSRVFIDATAGGLSVFLAKPPASVNILSDINCQMMKAASQINCKVLQRAHDLRNNLSKTALDKKIGAISKKLRAGKKVSAVEFLLHRKLTRDGLPCSPLVSQGCRKQVSRPKDRIERPLKYCGEYEKKLGAAKFLCEDFRVLIKKHNDKDVFLYIDPVYPIDEGRNPALQTLYQDGSYVPPSEVCALLKDFKGKFLLTYNDVPSVRQACAGFQAVKMPMQYSMASGKRRRKSRDYELVITNYKINGSKRLTAKTKLNTIKKL